MTMTAPTTTTPTATRTQVDSKALYAKLLANENLVVEHDPKADTAYFDTLDRRLILPVWRGMSNEVYNMLVGHEVAHALFTPTGDGWVADLVKIDPKNVGTVKGYFNVIEDARIERLLKQKYPGLRRDFLEGYDHMVKSDIFKIQGKDLAEMGLIDRINLHYKIGVFVNVPFTAEELPLVNEVAKTSTYADALDLTKRLYEFAKDQKRREREEQESGEGAGAGNDQDQNQDQDQRGGTGGEEGDEQEGDEGGTGDGEKFENPDETEDASASGNKGDGESKADKGKDKADNGGKEGGNGSGSGAGVTNGELNDAPEAPVTDGALDRASEKFREDRDRKSDYIDIPRWRNEATESPADVIKAFTNYNSGGWTATGARLYREFLAENQNAINLLYREFEQRRAADVQRRTRESDSGSIDVNRLWAYRVSEEVFATYQTVRDGQNHGLVFFIDWSGSMSPTLYETVKQCLCLAEFCRKAQIPFEVYAFSDNGSSLKDNKESCWDTSKCRNAASMSYLRLINFLSSRSNGNEFKNAAMAFLCAGHQGRIDRDCVVPPSLNLGGTPLNAATVAAMSIVPTFKAANRLQVVHALFLTDGGAGDDLYVEDFHDPLGNKQKIVRCAHRPYYRFNGWQTSKPNTGYSSCTNRLLLELLEAANPGTNVIGFFLETARNLKNHHGMKGDDGYVCHPKYNGYSQWFGIANSKSDDTNYWDRLNVKTNITASTVRTTMAREFAKVRGNRQFLARFAEIISKERK
jgi:hypothetical protein